MTKLSDVELFEVGEDADRRSVLFAIVVATGFLTVAAGASTLLSTTNVLFGVGLLVLGVTLCGGAIAIPLGALDEVLFRD